MMNIVRSVPLILRVTLFAVLAGTGVQAAPDFTITDNTASFSLTGTPNAATSTGPTTDFRVGGSSNPDQTFQTWWWYRLTGDTRESALNSPNANWTIDLGGTRASKDFTLAPNVLATMTWFVAGVADGMGILESSLKVTNNTNDEISVSLFHYLDSTLGGSINNESATFSPLTNFPANIRITAPNWRANYIDESNPRESVGYAVGAFPTIRDRLTNNAVDNFGDTGLPFGPGDFTGGYQWNLTIAAGATDQVTMAYAVAAVPEPPSLVLAVLGLAGVLVLRTKKGTTTTQSRIA